MKKISRRDSVRVMGGVALATLVAGDFQEKVFASAFEGIATFLAPINVNDPFAYPNRGWEKIYRDMWSYGFSH